jgi:hypothetical protein
MGLYTKRARWKLERDEGAGEKRVLTRRGGKDEEDNPGVVDFACYCIQT